MTAKTKITRSSGNVYADLGFEDPEAELAKAKLADAIDQVIAQHGWSRERAAGTLAIEPTVLDELLIGRLGRFSTEQLFRFLHTLGHDIEIVVSPAVPPRGEGRTEVTTNFPVSAT